MNPAKEILESFVPKYNLTLQRETNDAIAPMAKGFSNSPAAQAITEIKRVSESGTLANARNRLRDALETLSIAVSALKNIGDLTRNFADSPAAQAMAEIKRMSDSGTFANARNHLRDALETSSIAAAALKNMGDLLPAPDYQNLRRDNYHFDPPAFPVIPPNPVLETNHQLADLKEQIGALVALGREQAKLTQAIHEANKAALELAAQSAAESKASTALASTSIKLTGKGVHIATLALWATVITALLSILANVFVPIYLGQSHQTATTPIRSTASKTPQTSTQDKGTRPDPAPKTQGH